MKSLRVFLFSFPWLLSVSCAKPICGDFTLDPGEACDDGNLDDTDACTNSCSLASCGDGVVQVGVETCDDGDFEDTDACPTTCLNAACGDGFVQTGIEACDDGNLDDTDACTDVCSLAACGDGLVQVGVEICDDGNIIDGDGCESDCGLTQIVGLATGVGHTCALIVGGRVRCWGQGEGDGRLGYGNDEDIGDDETPASAGDVDVGGTVTQISAGIFHTCALLDTGAVRCWGDGESGRLGYGNTQNIGDDETPASAGDVPVF